MRRNQKEQWEYILAEISGDVPLDRYIDEVPLEELGNPTGRGAARGQMSRTGYGGDPLRGRGASAYDDIDDGEKTLGEDDDLEEYVTYLDGLVDNVLNEDAESKRRRVSTIRNIRGQIEHVWQMLGKAETKLGVAKFDADEQDFTGIEKTLSLLIGKITELMDKLELAREKVSLS